MPSIDLIRLRKQIAQLGNFLDSPAEFVNQYKSLLEFYHRWSHHQQEDFIPKSFMLAYDIPDQIIPEIELGLKPLLSAKTALIFPLVEGLRKDPHFECSSLAAFILGLSTQEQLPDVEQVLKEWLSTTPDRALIHLIFLKATLPLRSLGNQPYLKFLQSLVNSQNEKLANAGTIGLTEFMPSINLEDLPKVYLLIRPLFDDPKLKPENLKALIAPLAKKSPAETAYFVRKIISETPGQGIEALARSLLESFPDEQAEKIKTSIRNHTLRIN